MRYVEMKQTDIKIIKEKIWKGNDERCPVLGKHVPIEKMVLDHAHKTISEDYAPDKGTIRTALDFRVNAVLGKLENAIKRTGLDKDPDFNISDFLRRAADYFDAGPYIDEEGNLYVHPSEVKKEPTISKRNYNKLKKLYDKGAKFPEYPRSGKLTAKLAPLYEEYGVNPYN